MCEAHPFLLHRLKRITAAGIQWCAKLPGCLGTKRGKCLEANGEVKSLLSGKTIGLLHITKQNLIIVERLREIKLLVVKMIGNTVITGQCREGQIPREEGKGQDFRYLREAV